MTPRTLMPRIAAALLALLGGALVLPASAHSERPASDPEAIDMVARAILAPSVVSFTGTQFVAAWSALDPSASTSMMVDVEHSAGGRTVVQAHGSDTAARLYPPDASAWLAPGGPIDLLTAAHTLTVSGGADIAGRDTIVIDAVRADGTLAARLWLDHEMAVPLRREVYDASGRTVTASAFVEISLTSIESGTAGQATSATPKWPIPPQRLGQAELAELRANGWTCPRELASGMTLYEAKQVGSAVQLSYTDGVASVSVFEQPGRLDVAGLDGFTEHEAGHGVYYRAPGPPGRFVWETADRVVTVVADAPALVDAVLAAMPPVANESAGFLAQVGRGAQRLMSWVNPLD